jgi:hypothetical protein
MKHRVVDQYLANNGYKVVKKAFGEMEWIKELEPGNEDSITYLDVCTLEDLNIVHGSNVILPWDIALRWQILKNIDGIEFYIPSPEPLLVLKAKAAWDRNSDIQTTGGNPFLRDKVVKDRFDILSILFNCELDKEIIYGILKETEFTRFFKDAVAKAISDHVAREAHDMSREKLVDTEEKIEDMLKGVL